MASGLCNPITTDNLLFNVSWGEGFHSARTVPIQCPHSARTVPNTVPNCENTHFPGNCYSGKERDSGDTHSLYYENSTKTVCFYSWELCWALCGHCMGTVWALSRGGALRSGSSVKTRWSRPIDKFFCQSGIYVDVCMRMKAPCMNVQLLEPMSIAILSTGEALRSVSNVKSRCSRPIGATLANLGCV